MTKYTAFPRLEQFDRNQKFIVRREIKVSGKLFKYGEELDKNLLTTRRLRQMYEQRFVSMEQYASDEVSNTEPAFEQLPTRAILDWLNTRKVVVRKGWDRAKIIQKAYKTFYKEREAHGVAA